MEKTGRTTMRRSKKVLLSKILHVVGGELSGSGWNQERKSAG